MTPLQADLRWEGGSLLSCRSGGLEMPMDWDSRTAASPVQALVFALGGCMASDVVLILEKGRQPLRGLTAVLRADRAEKPPRRLLPRRHQVRRHRRRSRGQDRARDPAVPRDLLLGLALPGPGHRLDDVVRSRAGPAGVDFRRWRSPSSSAACWSPPAWPST